MAGVVPCTVGCGGSSGGGSGSFVQPDDPFLYQGLQQDWYATGRGPVDVEAAESANLLISNPVGSGKLLQIHRLRGHVTTASEYVAVIVNPTTNLPATGIPSSNRYLGAPAGVADVFMDDGPAMTGGTLLSYQIPVETSAETFTEFLIYPSIIVPPGFSIGAIFTNTSAGESKVVMLLDWREVDQ